MSIQKYFLISLALAFAAVCLHLASLSQISHGLNLRARAITKSDSERVALKADGKKYSNRGLLIGGLGLVFALASAVALIFSKWRHEPAPRLVTFTMLTVYLMLQFFHV